MKLTRVHLFLGVLLLGILLLAVFAGRDMSRPNYEFLPDMKHSPAYSAYSANPNFENGRTLQTPVPGTLARGELPLHFAATPTDAKRAGEELSNPLSGEKKSLRRSVVRGGAVYRVSCAVCHGASGSTAEIQKLPIVQRSIFRPKPLATGDSTKMKDGQLFHILTYGQGGMASFAGQLTQRQRWDAVNFIRDLQRRHANSQKLKTGKQAKPVKTGVKKSAPKAKEAKP